ncbi:hypothetical protein ACFL09_02920 [Planctomycetota bacterium]
MRLKCATAVPTLLAFWLATHCMGGETDLERAKQHDDFSKPGYDRDLAVRLYQQVLGDAATSDSEKLAVLHRMAQLCSYACKPGEKDNEQAEKYYRQFLVLCGDRVTMEKPFAMSHLASYQKDPEARFQEYLRIYAWTLSCLTDPEGLDKRIVFPPNTTDLQKRNYRRNVVHSLRVIQDRAGEEIVKLAAGFQDAAEHLGLLVELFRPGVSASATLSYGRLRERYAEGEALRPRPVGKAGTTRQETGRTPKGARKVGGGPVGEKPPERVLKAMKERGKWAAENPSRVKELVEFADKMWPKLRKTVEGRAKAREWLLRNRGLWEGSPAAGEVKELLLELEKESGQRKR